MGNPPAQKPSAQHYVPKFYLKGFTDKQAVLWVYERFKPKRPSKPKHEANRPDYYTHSEHGFRDESAEATLRPGDERCLLIKPFYSIYIFQQSGRVYVRNGLIEPVRTDGNGRVKWFARETHYSL